MRHPELVQLLEAERERGNFELGAGACPDDGQHARRRGHAVPAAAGRRPRTLEVILGGALFDAALAERYG